MSIALCRVAAVLLLAAADCAGALRVPSRGGLHARQVANLISRATQPVCMATSDEDKALLEASKKVHPLR